MIAIAPRPASGRRWGTLSFASTLHLCPILDLLLADVPSYCECELRLGLQEALVNAAVHGNKLDPTKTVLVQFFFLPQSILVDHFRPGWRFLLRVFRYVKA